MKLQLPTIIVLCLSFVVIVLLIVSMLYYMHEDKVEMGKSKGYLESEEFNMIRADGMAAYKARDFKQAIQTFEEALSMRPENAEVYNELGAAYYEFGLQYAGPGLALLGQQFGGENSRWSPTGTQYRDRSHWLRLHCAGFR